MAAPDEPTAPSPPASEAVASEPVKNGVQTEPAAVPPPPPPREPLLASTERFLRWRRLLDGGLVAMILLIAFEVGFFPVRNSEMLLHRAVGRRVAHREFDFRSDPFTFTSEGARWVDHSWLFGLFTFGMHEIGEWGDPALIVLKGLLLAALAELMLRLGRRPDRTLWIPALCTGLAILTLSPNALLQPACVSYLFLGLTLYLLDFPRRRHEAAGAAKPLPLWNVRWLIAPLCALWVNLDAWFILGPALVALYLLGETLQGSKAPKGSAASLAGVLAVSVLACLASPYHVYGFTLPEQLGLSPAGNELKDVAPFSFFFTSPFRNANTYFLFDINRSLAGVAYYPLVFLGVTSFILAPGSVRSWRGTVWGAFFLLSAWYGRAIPFFAVVAGPITALNLLDPVAGFRTEIPAELDRRRRVLSYRVLTLLLAFAGFTAGSAGWLHTPIWGRDTVADSRRPGWWEEYDGTLVETAKQIGDWQQRKLVSDETRLFNTSVNACNFLAWYAPGARVFIDSRLSLFPADVAHDYVVARGDLNKMPELPPDESGNATRPEPPWASVFRERKIEYLLVGEGDLSRRHPFLLEKLLNQPEDWTLASLYGGAAVFGWNGATSKGAAAYAPIRYDTGAVAFGSKAETAPPNRSPIPPPPEWWQIVWQPEVPRSPEVDNAGIHMLAFDAQNKRRAEQELTESYLRRILSSGAPFGPIANGTLASQYLFFTGDFHDSGPPADLYLALRASRRALAANPEDGRAWLRLAQAYSALTYATRERNLRGSVAAIREIRQVQIVTALTQAIRYNPELEPAHGLLANQFEQNRFIDLTLLHRKGQLTALTAELNTVAPRDENNRLVERERERLKELDAEVQRLQTQKKEREDRFELDGANKPPLQRAQLALRFGLAEAALKAAREQVQQLKDGSAEPRAMAPGMTLLVQLLIATGEIDEARYLVQEGGRQLFAGAGDRNLPVMPEAAADWYRVLIDAAAGDYADADETLDSLVISTGHVAISRDGPPASPTVLVAMGLGDQLLMQAAEAGRVTIVASRISQLLKQSGAVRVLTLQQGMQTCFTLLGQEADLQTLRVWLAVESGDIKTARRELNALRERAVKPHSMLNAYRSREVAALLLEWLDANARH